MATKIGVEQRQVSFVVFGPDGQIYSVFPDSERQPERLKGCEKALRALRKCLNSQSDEPVLSGVMIRANGKPASPKRVSQQSAKKRS
jgi:hypothetical protein